MKRSVFVAFALMTLILVFTACGGGATATPPPTQNIPPTQDVPLTTVIAMAKANEIREIQVDGKKLTVYPKIIAEGSVDSFVSRIGDDTDIIGLLIDSGVEVGPPSGVEVTIKGVSAEDVQAAISAALATSIVEEVLVTPTPGPALTPTPTATPAPSVTSKPIPTLIPMFTPVPTLTSTPTLELTPTATSTPTPTANPTTIPLPQRPLIRLRHNGQVYRGVEGDFCWPVDRQRPLDRLCGDEPYFPWEVLDTATPVPVAMGDSIIVEIDADDQPKGLQVAIYDNDAKSASAAAVQVVKLETGLTAPFSVDVPPGTYYIRISGQWDDGDISYKFEMLVT